MNPEVLVVGAGPVGLTMAAELARFGVPTRIIEKAAQRTDKSKALVVWSRTLELINRMGCSGKFVETGLKVTAANIIARDREIGHVRLDTNQTPYPYALMIPQSETERLMEEHLNACGVQVERQVELVRFDIDADKVTASLQHADGREEQVRAAWLIGCDGAHSSVRHGLGMQFEGDTLPSDWILGDVHLAGVKLKPDELSVYWHTEGALALFPISAGRYRVIADVGDADGNAHRPDPTLQEIQAVLDRRGPGGITVSEPIWLASFRINERKVAEYRAGRAFLAGDAAHVHSPAGGQGMNTGMQDACNLAWKLALVYKGLVAPEPILDSYSIERSAVGRQVLSDAGRLTAVAIVKSGLLQELRNHVASLVFGLSPVRKVMANKMAELSIGYPHSPLTRPGPHALSPAAGQRAPITDLAHPVGAGSEPRFALFAPTDSAGMELVARYRNLLEPEVRVPFADNGIWLVRPDGYVATVATREGWSDIDNYLHGIMSGTS